MNINNETKTIIDEFIAYKKYRNLSDRSLKEYRWTLHHFFSNGKKVNEINFDDVFCYLEDSKKNKKPKTTKKNLSILSSFFTYCFVEEIIEKIPIKKRWKIKVPESAPKYLEKNDQAKVIVQSEKRSLRDQVVVELLNSSGIRVSELTRLNVQDIDLSNHKALIQGKGKKERVCFFSEKCAVLLE